MTVEAPTSEPLTAPTDADRARADKWLATHWHEIHSMEFSALLAKELAAATRPLQALLVEGAGLVHSLVSGPAADPRLRAGERAAARTFVRRVSDALG